MKTYLVTIQAIVTKQIHVEAESDEQAAEEAHGEFSACEDGRVERYSEQIVSMCEL